MRCLRAALILLLLIGGFAVPGALGDEASPDPVTAFIETLDTSDDTTQQLATLLGTLAGRAALQDTLAAVEEAEKARRLRRALDVVLDEMTQASDVHRRYLSRIATQEVTPDLALLRRTITRLAQGLVVDHVVAADLRAFLQRPEAARILYEVLVRSRCRPGWPAGGMGRWFAPADDGRLVVPAALEAASTQLLDTLPAQGAVEVQGLEHDRLRTARWYASRLAADEALDPWRSLLCSPRALLLPSAPRGTPPRASDVLLRHSAFGRALVMEDDGSTRVNPHTVWELDDVMQRLLRREERTAPLREALESFGAGLEDPGLREQVGLESVQVVLVDAARREAGEAPIDAWALWREATLVQGEEGSTVRPEACPAVASLVDAAASTARALAEEGARTTLDPRALDVQTEHLDLLRSSIFYNPRTATGHWLYLTQFEDHAAARLFGTFGWNAKVSKDLADFKARIRARKRGLQQLARVHDKLIVHLSGVPPWLSSWKGTGTFENGGWEDKQAHPPRDVEVWKEMVRELARVMGDLEGVERYYEFWNEPDLKYWQGSLDEFLALYEATARAVKEIDPEGKVGGCATNQWDGRVHKRSGSDILNLELIRYARAHDVPLDFVSWHHFGRPVAHIRQAKQTYLAEWRKVGFEEEPEWLVTEWSNAYRGMPYANASFAELMLGFFHAGVDAQCASCWEEFHAKPDPKHFAPWGLLTQQGQRKNAWYVHRFFDRLARGSEGVAVTRDGEDRTLVVSKKGGGVHDILVWQRRTDARLKAAWKQLEDAGFTKADGRRYRTIDRLERAIARGEPVEPKWAQAFEAAHEAYEGHPVQASRCVLAFEGARSVEVLFAESVRMGHATKRVAVRGPELAFEIAPFEVVRLLVRVR